MKNLFLIIVTLTLLFTVSAVVAAFDLHDVVSQSPSLLIDGQTGTQYSQLNGYVTINWKDITRYGFFNAKVTVTSVLPALTYEFQLVSISNSNDDYIEGLFDITRNGVLVANGIVGKLYGTNLPVGQIVKFYGGNTQNNTMIWHVAGFITNRFDF